MDSELPQRITKREERPGEIELLVQIPPPLIGLFQSILESYEGLGTSRTEDENTGLVTVLTTPTMADECFCFIVSFLNEQEKRSANR